MKPAEGPIIVSEYPRKDEIVGKYWLDIKTMPYQDDWSGVYRNGNERFKINRKTGVVVRWKEY